MKKILFGVLAMVVGILLLAGCTQQKNQSAASTATNSTPQLSAGPVGFNIQKIMVENNYDPATKQSVQDHIELVLQNVIDKDISNLTAYYTVLDRKTGQNESYTSKLNGFVLKAHATETIHFDNENRANHFGANLYGIYYTSPNELKINVTISAEGYQAQSISAIKGAAGPETPD
jgi:hypothetical protein